MGAIKTIFFPDPLHEASTSLKGELSKTYGCFSSTHVDEFEQAFLQSGKFALVFSDAQAALKFLKLNEADMNKLQYKKFVLLNKSGKFSAESKKILDQFHLNIYSINETNKLLTEINSYFSSADVIENIDDIEFLLPEDVPDGTTSED